MNPVEAGLLRSAAFFAAMGYPPSFVEWVAAAEVTPGTPQRDVERVAENIIQSGRVIEYRGRAVLRGYESSIAEHEARRALFHGKLRKAKNVTRMLARLGGVRFVALCNTTALAHARADSDLDFFVIVKSGSIWQTRLLSALPYKILRRRPGEARAAEDAVCLSFFLDETSLDLEGLQIAKDGRVSDPYLRYWFLSLLPLFDDGISERLWKENRWVTDRHGLAPKWITHPDLRIEKPFPRIPTGAAIERAAKRFQTKSFPEAIRKAANKTSDVVIHDRMLKFHTKDRREEFRDAYERICRSLHIEP